MDKRKLSKEPRDPATPDMAKIARRLGGMTHIATAKLLNDERILQMTFYRISEVCKSKLEADFRTFFSESDYITQDMKTSKVKWLTGALDNMANFSPLTYTWDYKQREGSWKENVFIWSEEEKEIIDVFFSKYQDPEDKYNPWTAIHRFQDEVKDKRLDARRKKETDKIDAVMEPIKDAPAEFFDWVWDTGMSFSRYLIYKEDKKGMAVCKCTHCKNTGRVDRKEIRLRNNEKGVCPFCGSRVTVKAEGRMPSQIIDERWFMYVDSLGDGFVLRYFKASRHIRSKISVADIKEITVEQYAYEASRAFYTFPGEKPAYESYEWGVYKQRGLPRWCPGNGYIDCWECILYPGNLPGAWEHTPMKYSALEVLSANIPTVSVYYQRAIKAYLDFPKLEWLCKMGLNNLAVNIIDHKGYYGRMVGNVNYKGKTIYEILGLTKVNTKVLQAVDGDHYVLRLLQVSQQIGLQFKPEQLQEYYETFECNTDLLKQANRKVSLHKLVKYITKESENYPLGDKGGCWQYSYMRYTEREDPRIERKRNMANDWLEYIGWCRELKYDLDNMFIYMPKNFKKVHDRTAKEYQDLQDKKATAEKRRRERAAKKKMEQSREALAEILKANGGITNAFALKGKGLILVVPKSAEDIRAEGDALHHCVGGYVERVAKGETEIFFIRKEDSPEKPYYTMEWKDNRVAQCRGLHNCAMTPEVKAFADAFEKFMLATIKKNKQAKRKAG